MHDLETRHGWLIRKKHLYKACVVEKRPIPEKGFILYRNDFHEALEQEFESYLSDLRNDHDDLRAKFLKRMDSICGIGISPGNIRYFAYGSNMDPMEMKRKGVRTAKLLGKRHVSGYRVVFNKISAKHVAAANLQLDEEADTVWGCLYELDREDFDFLRKKEVGYFARRIEVESDGGATTEAQTFVARSSSVHSGRPSRGYLRVITDAAEKLGLPGEYIDGLKTRAGPSE